MVFLKDFFCPFDIELFFSLDAERVFNQQVDVMPEVNHRENTFSYWFRGFHLQDLKYFVAQPQ